MAKGKKYYEVNVQRGRRAKLQGLIGMKMASYDDEGYNNVNKKKFKRKPIKGRVDLDALQKGDEHE